MRALFLISTYIAQVKLSETPSDHDDESGDAFFALEAYRLDLEYDQTGPVVIAIPGADGADAETD